MRVVLLRRRLALLPVLPLLRSSRPGSARMPHSHDRPVSFARRPLDKERQSPSGVVESHRQWHTKSRHHIALMTLTTPFGTARDDVRLSLMCQCFQPHVLAGESPGCPHSTFEANGQVDGTHIHITATKATCDCPKTIPKGGGIVDRGRASSRFAPDLERTRERLMIVVVCRSVPSMFRQASGSWKSHTSTCLKIQSQSYV
jgi:hypothetical protein